MAAASPSSSRTWTGDCSTSAPATTQTVRTPDGPRHRRDCQRPPPVRPEADPAIAVTADRYALEHPSVLAARRINSTPQQQKTQMNANSIRVQLRPFAFLAL